MRIVYFRLKGYAGIKHGMGKDEITIPFMQFQTPMILIRGDNGCGKSTILKALSLDIDSSDNYCIDKYWNPAEPDQVEEIAYPAEKEIHLMDGQDVYKVLIQSPVKNKKRQTTKAYISLNGEELNPNGNVSSYKEIRNSIFDMDPNYINLSIVTSENRGLVDRKPAERKRYMSEIIGTLEFFNNLYRTLSKKSSVYRSSINQLKAKIYNIGDPDNLEMSLKSAINRRYRLEADKDILINDMAEMKATMKILDPDGKIQDLYSSILDDLGVINSQIEQYNKTLDRLYSEYGNSPQNDNIKEDKVDFENLLKSYETSMNKYKVDCVNILNDIDKIQSRLDELNAKMASWNSDHIRSDIETVVEDIRTKISLYDATFRGTNMDLTLTKSELMMIKDTIIDIKHNISQIYDNDNDVLMDILNNILENDAWKYLSKYNSKKQELESALRIKESTEAKLSTAVVLEKRPNGCTINDCPFIAHAVTFNVPELEALLKATDDKIAQLNIELSELYDIYIKENVIYTHVEAIMKCVHNTDRLLKRIPSIYNCISDRSTLIYNLMNHYQFNEFLEIDEMINMIDLVDDYKRQKELLVGYEADLKIWQNNQMMIQSIRAEIESLEKEMGDNKKQLEYTNNSIQNYTELIKSIAKKLTIIDNIILVEEALDMIKDSKKQLSEKFHKAKDDIAKVQDYVKKIDIAEQMIDNIMTEYNPLKDTINQMTFAIKQLASYRADLDRMESNFEKAEVLKKACNPSSGIQAIYISIYMDKTIIIANDILSYFFRGAVRLLKPVIDGDTFELPFINGQEGAVVPDVSMGSTSQKCMIGMAISFALLNQGSEKYNIFRLDEIDGGLDFRNSEQFTRMILPIMQSFHIEQAIMISHKMEIDTLNTTVIDVTSRGIAVNGTIIS